MNQYTYDFTIDPNAKSGATLSANPWSQLAYLTATDITLDSGELSSLKFQYRPKNTDTWMDVATTVNTAASSATATLTGLTSAMVYEYQLTDGEISIAKENLPRRRRSLYIMVALRSGINPEILGIPRRQRKPVILPLSGIQVTRALRREWVRSVVP